MTDAPFNHTEILDQLSAATNGETVTETDEIFELGIDSIRLMRLTDQWRSSRPDLDFAEVAGARTVGDLLKTLEVHSSTTS